MGWLDCPSSCGLRVYRRHLFSGLSRYGVTKRMHRLQVIKSSVSDIISSLTVFPHMVVRPSESSFRFAGACIAVARDLSPMSTGGVFFTYLDMSFVSYPILCYVTLRYVT